MRWLVVWEGDAVPVTHLFDIENDEVDELDDAVKFVAGPTARGQWIGGLVCECDFVRPH